MEYMDNLMKIHRLFSIKFNRLKFLIMIYSKMKIKNIKNKKKVLINMFNKKNKCI